jgi:UDP-N-acetylmuramoylalanine--D-glutamate ligase
MRMELRGKKITVIGLGKSGWSAASWLSRQNAMVTVSDIKRAEELDPRQAEELERLGVKLETGGHRSPTLLGSDLIVLSPGVDPNQAPLPAARKRKIPVIGEMELACRYIDVPILAVTGTNGKSTVTSLLGSLVRNAGYKAFVGGNLGTPLVEYLAAGEKADYVVLEVSSFQLDTIERFSPHVAVLLNITPDHLDRYPSYRAYAESKFRIFENQRPGQFAVLNDDDERLSRFDPPTRPTVFRYGTERRNRRQAFLEGNRLIVELPGSKPHAFDLRDFPLPGKHNIENLMAAVLAGEALRIAPGVIQETARSFRGLPHRIEHVARVGSVAFYDDSKATNVDAALRAVLSFERPVVLIAGGRHKGGDYGPLVRAAKGRVRKAVLLGESRSLMAGSFAGEIPFEFAEDMQDAVARAFSSAEKGEVVLLAPACSSFDMFTDYAHRGMAFKAAVEGLRDRT